MLITTVLVVEPLSSCSMLRVATIREWSHINNSVCTVLVSLTQVSYYSKQLYCRLQRLVCYKNKKCSFFLFAFYVCIRPWAHHSFSYAPRQHTCQIRLRAYRTFEYVAFKQSSYLFSSRNAQNKARGTGINFKKRQQNPITAAQVLHISRRETYPYVTHLSCVLSMDSNHSSLGVGKYFRTTIIRKHKCKVFEYSSSVFVTVRLKRVKNNFYNKD